MGASAPNVTTDPVAGAVSSEADVPPFDPHPTISAAAKTTAPPEANNIFFFLLILPSSIVKFGPIASPSIAFKRGLLF